MTSPWGVVISFLLGVISILLGVIVAQNKGMAEKIDQKLDSSLCKDCYSRTEKTIDSLWQAINTHTHSELPGTSRVVR